MPNRTDEELRAEIRDLESQLASRSARSTADMHRLSSLEIVMETVPVGIVLADADGHILHGNSHVESLVGHPVLYSEDVDDYGEWISYHEDGRRVQSREYPLARVLAGEEGEATLDVHYQRGDGTRFWMRIIGRAVHDATGETIGAAVILLDIDQERQMQETQSLLIAELDHRVKNAFAVVKSLVGQSLRKARTPASLRQTIDARLDAYADAHGRLVGASWDGGELQSIVGGMLNRLGNGRIELDGPELQLTASQGLSLYMAFYELATNAVKYGALSSPAGRVLLSWSRARMGEDVRLNMDWREQGGPRAVEPEETGFGSVLTGRAVAAEMRGEAKTVFAPEGVRWTLTAPWPATD